VTTSANLKLITPAVLLGALAPRRQIAQDGEEIRHRLTPAGLAVLNSTQGDSCLGNSNSLANELHKPAAA